MNFRKNFYLSLKLKTMKAAIDLDGFITDKGLDKAEIAAQLFPGNKFPKLALDRVVRGESALDANQISKLSAMTGVPVGDLFSAGGWKSVSRGSTVEFEKDGYTAIFEMGTQLTRIYHSESMVHEFMLHVNSMMTLTEYVLELESQIQKLK